MIDFAVIVALWIMVAALALGVARRSAPLLRESLRGGGGEFLHLVPQITIGVLGSGFIAAALPQDVVAHWLGSSSGVLGIVIATWPAR